jgi:membrane-associated phospholipid phosphatase
MAGARVSPPSFAASMLVRRERFVLRPAGTLVAAALLLGVVLVVAALVPARPLAVERHWAEWMHDLEGAAWTHAALVFNAIGKGFWRYLVVAAIALVLLLRRRGVALAAFALTEALTLLLVTGAKALSSRPRPPGPLVEAHGYSFPSGHAAYAAATALALALLLTEPGRRPRAFAWIGAAILASAMAWSRTYLQVHWAGDVVGGAALGVSVALGSFAVLQLLLPPRPGDAPRATAAPVRTRPR